MLDFKGIEERVLKFWEDQDVFRKSVGQRRGNKHFVVFEGPPFANGNPGIHHFIGRVFKDLFNRYQTMRGRFVLRKGGWDTHGLPVELGVEKALGFTNKKDIEKYGVAAYNAKCRESVWKYKSEWERFTRRIGYWVDLEHSYITYENAYIESLWNIIARFNERKLLYQAHRVVHFCTRCGTPLSSHEVAQKYQTVTDTSVYLKFQVKNQKSKAGIELPKNTFILAWTTTPWTLPGNVALAVGEHIKYVLVKKYDEYFVIAADLAEKVLGEPLEIEQEFTGKELVGTAYEPLFSVRALKKPKSYKVYAADFVTIADGTGVVHIAPMYGEDDYRLGDAVGLPKVHTVNEQGDFVGVSKELDGKYVKSADAEAVILEKLETDNCIFKTAPYEHEYPFCWRCDTPLLYYAKDSWFVRMSSLNKQMLANNETIHWVPSHLKEGRFGQWIKEGKDWALSRERYWGTPLPVWRSKDKKQMLVVSSLDDLEKYRADNPATFWMIRHGESQKNVEHVINDGTSPSPLTEIGRVQASAASKSLTGKFAAIITSPVERACETAHIIARELGIKNVVVDERLGEIKVGPSLDGHPDADYHKAYPTYESKFAERPPGGESLSDLKARVWGVLRDLNEKYAGKQVILVSHEYPIWMMADAARGWSMAESIAEKQKRDDDFISYAQSEKLIVKNLPRNEHGEVDVHRPYIDDIVLKKDGALLYRVPEIIDVWFDSGAMPYAQWHWPFENEELFKQQFPADFICEGIDQTRGWFYTLLAISTALGDPAPYRSVLSYGHVLDEKGQKMSKSKGNIVKPDEVIDAVGVDAARWYFYAANNPDDSKLFDMKEVRERLTGFMGTLANCVRFYELYSSGRASAPSVPDAHHHLDRWILSELNAVNAVAANALEKFDPTGAARALEHFVVDDFSQWWLRRSRKRADALPLLRYILRSLSLLLAPFIPFTAEDLWQKVKGDGDALSVHLADWPSANAASVDGDLSERMRTVREYISAGLAVRKEKQIKVRQPLQSVTVPGAKLHADLEELIRDELNVKEVLYALGKPVELDVNIGSELRAEGFARETMRAIQDMRKEAGCRVSDKVHCQWSTENSALADALSKYETLIMRETGLSAFVRQKDTATFSIEKNSELAPGVMLWIGIAA